MPKMKTHSGAKKRFRVTAVDHRGSGRSSAPSGATPARMMAPPTARIVSVLNQSRAARARGFSRR